MTVEDAIRSLGYETYDISDDSARGPARGGVEERRVTVDLDDADPLDLYRAWSVLADAGVEELRARVSAGGEGFHVRGFVTASAAVVERLRYQAGDHPRRTHMDRTHALKPDNITFSSKGDGEAGPWRETPWLAADDLRERSVRFGPPGWSV